MEDSADVHDWELIPASNLCETPKAVEVLDEDTEDGAIKADYFSLSYGGRRRPRSDEESDNGVSSDNPSWIEPDSDSRFLETSRGQLGFVETKFPIRDSGGFWSDESSDGKRSAANGENLEFGSLGDSATEIGSETMDALCEDIGEGFVGQGSSDAREMRPTGGGASIRENGKKIWWKLPLEFLKFCCFRIRPVWSISIAAAMVGIVMLGRKLYKMKHRSRNIQLRISVDDKKAAQFAARAARINDAFSVVRRMPIIRPSLPAGSTAQWAALPLR
ncbi:hypothetical protein AXF42_Ash014634 [Apostasia shenzhenica]|uniref:DUF6821 domain-containing protein n=1 Tax=Apostasia shenzhenica TaxID=1088818 RepID=A0A2I0AK75_9ASPA|nr:hypothetical protein AXF42_Ash014634 [Apostasia shenzhenica]